MAIVVGVIGSCLFSNYLKYLDVLKLIKNETDIEFIIAEDNTGIGRVSKLVNNKKQYNVKLYKDKKDIIINSDLIIGFYDEDYEEDREILEKIFRNYIFYNLDGELLISHIFRPIGYKYQWARTVRRGEPYFECSSKGHKEYSALYAKVNNKSIEEIYQLDIKGYRDKVKHWTEAKRKPPLTNITEEQAYNQYKMLWEEYFNNNRDLYINVLDKAVGKTITDMFGVTPINQARAICDLCNTGLIGLI